MGTPSDGKYYPPDECCPDCGEILIGDEVRRNVCEDCNGEE